MSTWRGVGGEDAELGAALKANAEAGLPAHDVSPLQGKFLHLLAKMQGARQILEIGTLGGYSSIWLARALPAGGRKPNNPRYLEWAVELSRPGSIIVGDNVVRGGAVADAQAQDPNVLGVRTFLSDLGRHPRLSATALQTVGIKGYDGFSVALVSAP